MSVLMSANKNKSAAAKQAAKRAKKKLKRYRVPSIAAETGPPLSDEQTSVWYWLLDGQPVTVTFNKHNNEVWYNGFIVETFEGFIEDEEDDDVLSDEGDVLDFTLFVAETQTSHRGRLQRLAQPQANGLSTHLLSIDDYIIPEHLPHEYDEGDDLDYEALAGYDPSVDCSAYLTSDRK